MDVPCPLRFAFGRGEFNCAPPRTSVSLCRARSDLGRSGRPGRRLAVALLAVGIAAGVLSVGSGPVQAAAADVQTDRLRGATRYETAVAIAEAFVDEIEGGSLGGEVDTVVLTSGVDEHFGYVLPAPALSRRRQAPVLLTEPDELPGAVRRFIESHGIAEVVILGGTGVVSAEVEREVDDLSGVSVERIAGRDVYATAVEVAKTVGPSIRFPGRFSRTVLLATGETLRMRLLRGRWRTWARTRCC